MNQYFNVYFDSAGKLRVAPRNNVEAMALKHLKHQMTESPDEELIVIDTEPAIPLGNE